MLGHGGFGTTMGALAAGVPQVVAPIFTTDQVVNGRHVAACGAGVVVEPGPGGRHARRARCADAARRTVVRERPRARVAAEIADLPGPDGAGARRAGQRH